MLIPSIDIMNGRAVQLRKGEELVLSGRQSPLELAQEFNRFGEVAVIDLDAALGTGNNRQLIKDICKVADVRTGGGLRDVESARELLRAGAKKVIIGTKAEPEFLSELPADRVIVALDQVNGKVVDDGWRHSTSESVLSRAQRLAPFCNGFLSTFVQQEGCLAGMDKNMVTALRDALPHPLTIAGGIASTDEVVALNRLGIDTQVGMALYTGKINLCEAFTGSLRFDAAGLIPTIVQDIFGQVLMMAYSSCESLRIALTEGTGTYFSRSRSQLWTKGKISGHTQKLLACRADCDGDSLIFTVEQTQEACHTGSYSCFDQSPSRPFNLPKLFQVINSRKNNYSKKSYTVELLQDRRKLSRKIIEEAYEVISFSSQDNLRWEIADLLYFLCVLAADEGISWQEIERELGGRFK